MVYFPLRSYRLKTNPVLGRLFGVGSGGCTAFHSGIGNVSYVKDILTETVVTTQFNCSKFGPNTDVNLGWVSVAKYCSQNYFNSDFLVMVANY